MVSPVPQQQPAVASHASIMKLQCGEGKLSDVKGVKRRDCHALRLVGMLRANGSTSSRIRDSRTWTSALKAALAWRNGRLAVNSIEAVQARAGTVPGNRST
jgi:hypothetical protein